VGDLFDAADELLIPFSAKVLPKADLHVHAEADARLDRMLALRDGRSPFDWQRLG
jgi:hypothetical protein